MTSKPKILVIEDEPDVLMMMALLLTRAGCEVLTAWNGDKGLSMAGTEDVDLVTLDIDLPDITGFEVYRRLKENPRLCHLPVIFVSGRASEKDRRRGFELGAAGYIDKPFDAATFVDTIFSHIKVAQPQA